MLRRKYKKLVKNNGQSAVEYLLLLGVVVAIVMVGMSKDGPWMKRIGNTANLFYNKAANGILGPQPACGDGTCSTFEDPNRCPVDC